MKKNKFILGFIICAVLCIGIGFAALTTELSVTGTLSTTEANASLIFSNAESSDESATLGSTGTNSITIGSSKFKETGDTVTFTLTVTNKSDKDLKVKITNTSEVTNNNSEYFQVTYSGLTTDDVVDANSGTGTITITCKLLKTPVTTQSATFSFTISGTATL